MITAQISRFSYREKPVLENIDLVFETGRTHGIVGLNGAGKTTFFNLLAGFIRDENAVFAKDNLPLLRKETGFIDTDLYFYPKLSAREFLSVFPAKKNSYNEEQLAALFRLPLDGFMEEFSTGMKKKLLLMSQIKQDREIYILDEPFNGLDLETNKILEVIISVLNERGKTIFIASHILDPLLNVCSEIHYIRNQTIYKTFKKEEFGLISEELFGNYTRMLERDLKEMI